MWYDAARNRYFRITNDNRGPPRRSSNRPEHPGAEKAKRGFSVSQFLRRTEEGRDAMISHSLPMTLLANSKVKPVHFRERRHRANDSYIPDAIPVLGGCKRIALCAYPTFEIVAQFLNGLDILDMYWSCPPGLVAATSCIVYRSDIQHIVTVRPLGSSSEERCRRSSFLCCHSVEPSHAVTIEAQSRNVFLAGDTMTQRFDLDRFTGFPHPDGSAGLSVAATLNQVLTGTRTGNIYIWDVRARPHRPACSFRPSKKHSAVTDLKPSTDGNYLYVSCMRNKSNNLAKWDLRKYSSEPAVVFSGHRNSHKSLKFDIEETTSGGILLAGGDDSVVRAWNTHTGGAGVECARLPGEIPKLVKFAGWGRESRAAPGAWIVSNVGKYVMQSGQR